MSHEEQPGLEQQVAVDRDEVRTRIRLAQDIVLAMGEQEIAQRVVEHEISGENLAVLFRSAN